METKDNPMFSVEFLFKDLSEAGFERIDAELQRIAGFSVVELEDEEDTPLMGLRFSLSEDGKVVHQYYPPPKGHRHHFRQAEVRLQGRRVPRPSQPRHLPLYGLEKGAETMMYVKGNGTSPMQATCMP